MNEILIPSKKVSITVIGEFLLACNAVGEDKVIQALRNVQQLSNQNLKKYIISVTCQAFEVHPSFLRNLKIAKMTDEQKICFSAVIFLLKKHMRITYAEILKLLSLKNVHNWEKLSKYNSVISRLDDKQPVHQRYMRLINTSDQNIKQYILTYYDNNNGKEIPTQRIGNK